MARLMDSMKKTSTDVWQLDLRTTGRSTLTHAAAHRKAD